MTTYFVRYVVQPEYQTTEDAGLDCNQGIPITGEESESWRCSSTIVLGMCVTSLLLFAFLGTPFWLAMAKYAGKHNAWLFWSLSMAMTNILLVSVSKGDVTRIILISGLNGLPLGAKFLSDSVLADIIGKNTRRKK